MNNSMEPLWWGLGVGLAFFGFFAGCALLAWAFKEKEDGDE